MRMEAIPVEKLLKLETVIFCGGLFKMSSPITLEDKTRSQNILTLPGVVVDCIHESSSSSAVRCIEQVDASSFILGFKNGFTSVGKILGNKFELTKSWQSSEECVDFILIIENRYIITNDNDGIIEFRALDGTLIRRINFFGFILHLPKYQSFILVPNLQSTKSCCWSVRDDADIKSVDLFANICIPHLPFLVIKAITTPRNTIWMASFGEEGLVYNISSDDLKKIVLPSHVITAWLVWDDSMVIANAGSHIYLYDMEGNSKISVSTKMDNITELCVWKDSLICGEWCGRSHFFRRTQDNIEWIGAIEGVWQTFICSMKVFHGMLLHAAGCALRAWRGNLYNQFIDLVSVRWDWKYIRLLWIGHKDPESTLSKLPKDLIQFIVQILNATPFSSVPITNLDDSNNPIDQAKKKRKRKHK